MKIFEIKEDQLSSLFAALGKVELEKAIGGWSILQQVANQFVREENINVDNEKQKEDGEK